MDFIQEVFCSKCAARKEIRQVRESKTKRKKSRKLQLQNYTEETRKISICNTSRELGGRWGKSCIECFGCIFTIPGGDCPRWMAGVCLSLWSGARIYVSLFINFNLYELIYDCFSILSLSSSQHGVILWKWIKRVNIMWKFISDNQCMLL